MKTGFVFLVSAIVVCGAAVAQNSAMDVSSGQRIITPLVGNLVQPRPKPDYDPASGTDRYTLEVTRTDRGTSKPLDMTKVEQLCGDMDGCSVRIGLYNWDDTGRVASREFLLFYNKQNHAWRASAGDTAGADMNNVTEHVNQSWSCYLTDGEYKNWNDLGDAGRGFGLLAWDQYNGGCFLTIID